VSKIDAARRLIDENQMNLLARALCDKSFAKHNPALAATLKNFNDDMLKALRRRHEKARP